MQSFFRSDAGKVPESKRVLCSFSLGSIPFQVNPQRHYLNFFPRNAQISGHELLVVVADGDECIDIFAVLANEIMRFAAIRFEQAVEKKIFTLKRADNRAIQCFLERPGES